MTYIYSNSYIPFSEILYNGVAGISSEIQSDLIQFGEFRFSSKEGVYALHEKIICDELISVCNEQFFYQSNGVRSFYSYPSLSTLSHRKTTYPDHHKYIYDGFLGFLSKCIFIS